ncbi:hypothetical protein JKF63_00398 [Porcisia hertigi]|uniref:Generative cell specific-1/HAP2 domain-containing protein n=1 Tax=Porcisia hertigi TaxID=2761500 RepID=A0A836HZ00_9TRYP|nr:hypothetical protein JKF63_00398 [Porcisia hertigi]
MWHIGGGVSSAMGPVSTSSPLSNMVAEAAAMPYSSRHASLPYIQPHRRYHVCLFCMPPLSRMFLIALLFLMVYVGQGRCTEVDVGSMTNVEMHGATATAYVRNCDNASTATLPGCQRKLVVDITLKDTVPGAPIFETEVTVAKALDQSLYPRDVEANAARTAATSLRVSLPPISVSLKRGAVQMRYGLTYIRTFPASLQEYVVPLQTARSCVDKNKHCPRYTNTEGELVSKPAGLCCLCSDVQCFKGSLCQDPMRTQFCYQSAAAGSICLREKGIKYRGYTVGESSGYYTLRLSAKGEGIAPTTLETSTDISEVNSNASVLRLLKAFNGTSGKTHTGANVTGRVLFIPSSGSTGINSNISDVRDDNPAEWMLLPAPLVSLSGKECDKVGISQEYFYSLPSEEHCAVHRGTCLRNQLADYRAEDQERISQGMGAIYLAVYLGTFRRQTKGEEEFLLDEVLRTGGATLRWTVSADKLKLKPLPAHGVLDAVWFDSGASLLNVTIRNSNSYAGIYYIALVQCQRTRASPCDSNGATGECVRKVLVPGGNTSSVQQFSVTRPPADGTRSNASCIVVLRDADSVVLTSRNAFWFIESMGTTPAPTTLKAKQCRSCAFIDIRCLFSTVCEWQMLVWTCIAVVVGWTPYAFLAYWRIFWRLGLKYVARPR